MISNHPPLPGFQDILIARERIRDRVLDTPVVNSPALDIVLGCSVWLKCELAQPTGAFKVRGACNAVAALREQGDSTDVATHSSGNHGAALAMAARMDGRRAHIVMPRDAVARKIESVKAEGGQVILCEPGQVPREQGLKALVEQGMVPIPPYDHPDIIAGQGTAAVELIESMDDIDCLLAPVGGGGLLSGSAIAARQLRPGIRIIGAEPEGAADAHASFTSGKRVTHWQPDTIADGLRAIIGVMTFELIQALVDDILLVSEQAIVDAMRLVWNTTGLAIEPSSAVAIAAIQQHPGEFSGTRTGVIVTGGNVDREQFPWMAE